MIYIDDCVGKRLCDEVMKARVFLFLLVSCAAWVGMNIHTFSLICSCVPMYA